MKRIVHFYLSDSAKLEPGFKIDEDYGYRGDYLGIVKIDKQNLMFARLRDCHDIWTGNNIIAILNVAYSGGNVYFNADWNSKYYFHNSPLDKIINFYENNVSNRLKGDETLEEVLDSLNIQYTASPIREKIESLFEVDHDNSSYAFPSDWDYNDITDYRVDEEGWPATKYFKAQNLDLYGVGSFEIFHRCSSFKNTKTKVKKIDNIQK